MKINFFLLSGIIGIAISGFVLNGCHKDSAVAPTTNTDITPAEDDANATFAANDAKSISDAAIAWNTNHSTNITHPDRGIGDIFGHCVTVYGEDTTVGGSHDTVVYINFGTGDCFCRDSRNRRGTIIVYWGLTRPGETWLEAYFDSANTITETFRNYYLRDNGIAGMRTWTNEGHNVNDYQNWNFTADLTITYPDGRTATWNSTRNNTMTEVSLTWYYEITGSSHGLSRDGVDYTMTISSPVYFTVLPWWAGGCPWPEAGTITIRRILTASAGTSTAMPASTASVTTVNFGTLGTCTPNMYANLDGMRYPYIMW